MTNLLKISIIILIGFFASEISAQTDDQIDKGHIWLIASCLKLTFTVQDQLDNPNDKVVKFVVIDKAAQSEFVSEKKYQLGAVNEATYPDDFHLTKQPQFKAVPSCIGHQLEWRIYINGTLYEYGKTENKTLKYRNNGRMVTPAPIH